MPSGGGAYSASISAAMCRSTASQRAKAAVAISSTSTPSANQVRRHLDEKNHLAFITSYKTDTGASSSRPFTSCTASGGDDARNRNQALVPEESRTRHGRRCAGQRRDRSCIG